MDRQYLIRLPWPPKECAPNGQHGHWSKKSSAAKSYKEACAWECKAQYVQPVVTDAIVVEVTFNPPSNRKYDLDNALARCKQGLDAVAEAIGVDDANWREMRLVRGEKVHNGAVLVHVKKADTYPLDGEITDAWSGCGV